MALSLKDVLDIVKTGDIKAAEAAIKEILSTKKDNMVKEATDMITATLFEGDDKGEEDDDDQDKDKSKEDDDDDKDLDEGDKNKKKD